MKPKGITHTFNYGDGRTLTMETGRLAKQADGAVIVRMGDCMLLATVVSSQEPKEGTDYLPLSVDYQEKYAGAGRFPGGFFKREARPSEYEILISRLIDRALRPMFPEDYHADIQVLVTMISADKNVPPDALAGLAASAAIMVSDIPFNGPISEVRVARVDGKLIINPPMADIERADINLIVAGTMENIIMVEGEMNEVSEADMVEALKFGSEAVKLQCKAQIEFRELAGSKPKREYNHEDHDEELKKALHNFAFEKIADVARKGNAVKAERHEAMDKIREDFLATLTEEQQEEKAGMLKRYFYEVEYDAVRSVILKTKKRLDGRGLEDIRSIWCETDYLPSAHGSALFTRGETQSLTTVTLGTKLDEQIIDGAIIFGYNRFMLHYNFPAFSTGEVKPNRGLGRREVGHGNLAMRSLKVVLPAENFPYTLRIVSDILESNGSSSMATVCAGTLAMMDAGVKIRRPVSGIAMGLITDGKDFAVLSDILGDEDHLGDMDFKVTGTEKGICACQMDLKVQGLPEDILIHALEQARAGRLHILSEMLKVITAPREDYRPNVPRIEKMVIPKEFIGAVIGPGGKVIQEMQRETGATISIEEVDNQGIIEIASSDKKSIEDVKRRINAITAVPEIGAVYEGKVKNIMDFGAFIEILPNRDGLLHISEISWDRLNTMEGVFKPGEMVKVKLIDVDKKTGKLKLSRKVLLPKPEKQQNAVSEESKS